MGSQVKEFLKNNNIKQVDYIASHGHTAFHNPKERYTSQIGNGADIAAATGITTISDFRSLDVALGGQGAPLVPIGDQLLFGEYTYCLNLGGYSNISFEKNKKRLAYDICPVNKAINFLAQKLSKEFDRNGETARSGTVNTLLLSHLNSLEYYRQDYPKSLGDRWLNAEFLPVTDRFNVSVEDKLRTVCEHIAQQIAAATNHTSHKSILTTGGGAHNKFLIECIRQHNQNKIILPENHLIDFKEALVFAFMGVLRIENETNCLSSVTGAAKDSSGGIIHRV